MREVRGLRLGFPVLRRRRSDCRRSGAEEEEGEGEKAHSWRESGGFGDTDVGGGGGNA